MLKYSNFLLVISISTFLNAACQDPQDNEFTGPFLTMEEIEEARLAAHDLAVGDDESKLASTRLYEQILSDVRVLYDEENHPDGHIEIVKSLTSLSGSNVKAKRLQRAIDLQEEAFAMCKKLYPESGWPVGAAETATAAIKLNHRYCCTKNFEDAQFPIDEAQRIIDANEFVPSVDVVLMNAELAYQLDSMHDDAKAKKYCLKALNDATQLQNQKNAKRTADERNEIAFSILKCGNVLYQQTDYEGGERCFLRALEITEELPPKTVRFTRAMSIRMLGKTYRDMGQYQQAIPYFEKAVEMFEQTQYIQIGRLTLEFTICHRMAGDLEQARHWLERTLAYRGTVNRGDEVDVVVEHAALLTLEGKSAEAVELLTRQKKKMLESGRLDLVRLAAIYQRLAEAELKRENVELAAVHYEDMAETNSRYLATLLAQFREAALMNLLSGFWERTEEYLASTETLNTETHAYRQYKVVARQRGLAGRATRLRNAVRQKLKPENNATLKSYLEVSNEIASLARNSDAATKEKLAELKIKQELLDAQLAEQAPDFARLADVLDTDVKDMQKGLRENEVLIDIVEYQDASGNDGGSQAYAAFVLTRNHIARIKIPNAEDIQQQIKGWYKRIDNGLPDKQFATQLHAALWQPISKHIPSQADTAYICADGTLYLLPWCALQDSEGNILLEKYAIGLPSAPQALLTRNAPTETSSGGEMVLVGNIDYEWSEDEDEIPALPYSKPEIEGIGEIASANGASVAKLEKGMAKLADVIRKLVEAKWIHFATHGKYESDPLLAASSERSVSASTLTKSSLTVSGRTNRELNGEMIANLDLRQVSLVFLSACQSGIGNSFKGEGIFGLQRAFHLAGARNVICSLWNIGDASASALATSFYEHHLAQGMSKMQALRHAQLKIYRNPIRVAEYRRQSGVKMILKKPLRPKKSAKFSHTAQWAGLIFFGIE
ncbi:MAG: CHAT domain-containing tetratricopeptide repeat protein [Planctomycetota bacterium]